jgi:hypothetical protein
MPAVLLPMPRFTGVSDGYGHARMPRGATVPQPERIDRVAYGRFRNVYLYITEACQLCCEHCYMGERLDRALKMRHSQRSPRTPVQFARHSFRCPNDQN